MLAKGKWFEQQLLTLEVLTFVCSRVRSSHPVEPHQKGGFYSLMLRTALSLDQCGVPYTSTLIIEAPESILKDLTGGDVLSLLRSPSRGCCGVGNFGSKIPRQGGCEQYMAEGYPVKIPFPELCSLSSPQISLCCFGEDEGVSLILFHTLPAAAGELFLQ